MIKEKKKKRRRRWPIELIRPREEGRMRTRVETTVEPSTTTSWTVLRRFESRNKSERGRVMFVPRLSRYFNSLFLSLSRSLRSKRRKKNCNYGWRLIYIYSFLSLSCIPYIERIVRDDLLFGKNIGGAPTDYSLPNTCVAR